MLMPACSCTVDHGGLHEDRTTACVQDGLAAVKFLPKRSSCVAFTCAPLCGQLVIFDYHTSSPVHHINLPQTIQCLAASPVSGLFAAGGADASLFLADCRTGSWRELAGHSHAVQSVAFASTSDCVVSSGGATMMRWNVVADHLA
jgi:WD40 repeat protein